MTAKGFNHVGLATNDMEGTIAFYEGKLGFPVVRYDEMPVAEGGSVRHVFFDVGHHQFLAFMEPKGVPGIVGPTDPGLNEGLGLPPVFYHLAFEAGSSEWLRNKHDQLVDLGIDVSGIIDHEWLFGISFTDPINRLSLEFACQSRDLVPDEAQQEARFSIALSDLFERTTERRLSYYE